MSDTDLPTHIIEAMNKVLDEENGVARAKLIEAKYREEREWERAQSRREKIRGRRGILDGRGNRAARRKARAIDRKVR